MARRPAIIILFALLLFQVFWHFNLLFLVQGNIRLSAWIFAAGIRLYRDFYLHYPPAMPWVIATLQQWLPAGLDAFRLVYVASTLGTTALLFFFCQRFFKSWSAAVVGGTIFSFWIFFWGKNMFWYHTPILLLSFAAFMLLFFRERFLLFPFIAGILLGIAFLFKQPAVFFVLAFGVVLLFEGRGVSFRQRLTETVIFGFGAWVPVLAIAGIYFFNGDLLPLWENAIHQGLNTGRSQGFFEASWLDVPPPRILVQFALYYYLFLFVARWRRMSSARRFPHSLVLAGAIAGSAFAFPRIWPQYTQFALPFLVVMVVSALLHSRGGIWLPPRRWNTLDTSGVRFAIVFLITLLPMVGNFLPYFKQTDPRVRTLTPVVTWLQQNTSPDEKIFVCCTAPEVYVDAKRKPASRYTEYSPPMLVSLPLEEEIIADLEQSKPHIIVELRDTYWERLNVVYMEKVLAYIQENYQLVAEVGEEQYIYERVE